MFELVYHSLAVENLKATDIQDILAVARDFNAKHEITGCLIYHNNRFIQLLEGDEKIVRELYASIEKDPRHTHVTLMATGKEVDRLFESWSMAFHQLGDSEASEMDRMLFVHNFNAYAEMTEKPTVTIRMFFELVKQLLKQ
jgi:hypothetical protein